MSGKFVVMMGLRMKKLSKLYFIRKWGKYLDVYSMDNFDRGIIYFVGVVSILVKLVVILSSNFKTLIE